MLLLPKFLFRGAIQICIALMADSKSNSNNLYAHLVANSLFTPRQLSIISKRLQGGGRAQDISSGAYYRQVKQCRDKVNAVLYSMILLQSTGVVQPETLSAIGRLAEQLSVIFASESSDVASRLSVDDVISVMDQLVKRMSKL
ncbi:hypothetical protein Ngar_c35990 [Candidatus Nitrososphaera gargensis Ga9.2]|uniref:Uncharacterized protein n=2 Tax=Candidatus Nitrososphaera gargensis TaxID=497727 RepID=K0IMR5_NITGG|nr:hypothetical protein Ngar_c35990 [Candidatus Nitrososphaera gargensis Ga9.2]